MLEDRGDDIRCVDAGNHAELATALWAGLDVDGESFKRELCERFGVAAQGFDGTQHALLHPFDSEGRRHMEYVREGGSFDDVPFEEMMRVLKQTYGDDVGLSGGESEPIFEA